MTVDKNWSIPSTSYLVFEEAENNEAVLIPGSGMDVTHCSNKSLHSFDDNEGDDELTENSDVESSSNNIFIEDALLQKHHLKAKQSIHGSWSPSTKMVNLSLCSIPEDQNVTSAYFLVPRRKRHDDDKVDDEDSAYEDDDEPIYHRSPVSLENGYRPAVLELRFFQGQSDNHDEVNRGSTTSDEEDFKIELEFSTRTSELRETAPTPLARESPVVVRLLVWLLHLLAGLLVVSMCLVSVSFIALLSFHHFR